MDETLLFVVIVLQLIVVSISLNWKIWSHVLSLLPGLLSLIVAGVTVPVSVLVGVYSVAVNLPLELQLAPCVHDDCEEVRRSPQVELG